MSTDLLIGLAALVALVATSLYALFGGADFGGGVWDVLASGPRRDEQRTTIGHVIGPVWETNHVWLIFTIVVLFTCFPPAFASISIGLFVPLTFVLVGIILRGAAYAYRAHGEEGATSPFWGHVFGIASVIAPFFFGTAVGGLTIGGYRWSAPFSLAIGVLAVALCAQIAAVFLTLETGGALRSDFRARAIGATFALATVGAIALGIAGVTEPRTFAALVGAHSLPGIAVAMALGFVVLGALVARRFAFARVAVAGETIAVLVGWYIAQAPYIVPGELTVMSAAAPPAVLRAFLWLTAGGTVLLVPSLLLLFRVFRNDPAHESVQH
ncbi:MAG: cytochrome d ubiquinol oxidase subunit II [Vulcanimicrobiaceae bacterium]